jgi:serine/threonine protein phosphatase PrpC
VYTDGLTDSIAGEAPERQVREAMAGTPAETLERLTKLIQPKLAVDDVTLVVVRRAG